MPNEPDSCVESDSAIWDARRRAGFRLDFEGAARRGALPSRGTWLAEKTAGWRLRPNRVSGLDCSANGSRRQSAAQSFLKNPVPWRLPACCESGDFHFSSTPAREWVEPYPALGRDEATSRNASIVEWRYRDLDTSPINTLLGPGAYWAAGAHRMDGAKFGAHTSHLRKLRDGGMRGGAAYQDPAPRPRCE